MNALGAKWCYVNAAGYGTAALVTRLAITLFVLGTILCSSARPQKHSIEFYFVKTDNTKSDTQIDFEWADSTTIDTVNLDAIPFLTDRDIIKYDWSRHTMAITPEAAARFPTWNQIPFTGMHFVVIADGVRCYRAAFSNPLSSFGVGGPQIIGLSYDPGAIRISGGGTRYTDRKGIAHDLPDNRENEILRDALRALGKLGTIEPDTTRTLSTPTPIKGDAANDPAGEPDCPDSYDVVKLNTCIAVALSEGADWPYHPLATVYELFGASPKVCVPNTNASAAAACATDSSLDIAFRATAPADTIADRWHKAVFEFAPDGSLRVSKVRAIAQTTGAPVKLAPQFGSLAAAFDVVSKGPVEWLAFLGTRDRPVYAHNPPGNWIREEHLPALMRLIDSTTLCAGVEGDPSPFSSFPSIRTTRSTIGAEAARLIQGFREGRYPPWTRADVVEIKKWWSERSGS